MRSRDRGFSLLELTVVICIVAVLAMVLLSRLRRLQADAERASMEHVLGSLRSAVGIEFAAQISRGTPLRILDLVGTNPMDRLAVAPQNYLGPLEALDPPKNAAGHWYFDERQGLLIYIVRFDRYFESELPPPARVRVKFEPVGDDDSKSRNFVSKKNSLRGLALVAVEPYRWLVD